MYEVENAKIAFSKGSINNSDDIGMVITGVSSVIHVAGFISFGTHPDYEKMQLVNVEGMLTKQRNIFVIYIFKIVSKFNIQYVFRG